MPTPREILQIDIINIPKEALEIAPGLSFLQEKREENMEYA